jgi:putative aldouronate transport system permease protein
LLDSIWALIVPDLVAVFSIVLLLNFFRGIPRELEEAAFIDGAGHWKTLWYVFVPLSMPALATLTLFAAVSQWNQWFDGMIYMKTPDGYPLSTYLQSVVINPDIDFSSITDPELLDQISSRTTKAAQIFLGAAPILLLYPFLQKYFVKGIIMGSVKE